MESVNDHAGLIERLGGGVRVAEGLERLDVEDPPKDGTVRAWAARNRIPTEYWTGMIQLAAEEGLAVSADWLLEKTPRRKRADAEAVAA